MTARGREDWRALLLPLGLQRLLNCRLLLSTHEVLRQQSGRCERRRCCLQMRRHCTEVNALQCLAADLLAKHLNGIALGCGVRL